MPPSIQQQVTFLYTRDLAASAAFYEDVLGLELALDQGSCRIYRAAGEAFLGVCGGRDPSPAGVILTLVSQDVEGWHEHLLAHGVRIEKPPTYNADYDIEHLFALDPAGYRVEIQRFLSPDWPAVRSP